MEASLARFHELGNQSVVPERKTFRFLFDANLKMMRVVCSEPKLFECMREAFSADNETAFFVQMHGYRANDKVYLINAFGYFKPGLLFDVLQYVQVHFGSLSSVYMSEQCREYVTEYLTPLKSVLRGVDRETFEVMNICEDSGRNAAQTDENRRFYLRDYQEAAIEKVIFDGYGRGLIELPTSAGKSLVIANLIYTLENRVLSGLKYLIFVPNTQLVAQFYGDLLDYGFPSDMVTQLVSGGKGRRKFNPYASIVISNRQFLFKNKDKIPKVDVLINDEVHQGKPKSATIDIVDDLDCRMKIGFSGTLPRGKYERLSLVGSFGRVLYVEDITDLQRRGFISELEINLIRVNDRKVAADRNLLFHENSFRRFSSKNANGPSFDAAYNAEIEYINANYDKLYAPVVEKLARLEGNTLVLFDRLEFGGNMFELAKTISGNRGVFYIDGQTPISEREAMRSTLERSNDSIVFGQCSILSTGINIKNLTNLVMMVSTKSFSRVLQSIGRTLRLHKDKDRARLFDISFNFKYSQKHLRERLQIYRDMYKKTPDTTTVVDV